MLISLDNLIAYIVYIYVIEIIKIVYCMCL